MKRPGQVARRGLLRGAVAVAAAACAGTDDATPPACVTHSKGVDPAYCLVAADVVRVPGVASLAVGHAQLFNVDEQTAVIVARDEGGFHALSGICTHACCVVSVCLTPSCSALTPTPGECSASAVAEVGSTTSSVLCPCHASNFRLADGEPTNPPAITALPSYDLRFDGEDALVDTATRVDPSARVLAPA